MSWVDFHYIKTGTGELSGPSFVDQTEQAINELGDYFENVEGTANSALSQAQNAQQTANAAQQTANSAVSQAQNAQASADAAQQAADQAQTTADNALEAAQNAGDEAGTKAPIMHASDATTYGVGSSALYGHVQLSDATNGAENAASGGTAATPYAVAQAMTAAQTAQQTADAAQQVGQTAQQTANSAVSQAQNAQASADAAQQTADAAQSALDQSVENINTQILNLSQMQDFAVTSTAIDVTAYAGTFSRLYLTSDASASTGLPTGISYPCFFWTLRTKGSDNAFMFVLSNNVLYSQSGENTTPDGDTPTWSFTGWQKITYAAATTSALGVVKADGTTVEVASDGTLSINTNLLSQVYKFKGSVATVDDLPTGAEQGDVYNVTATDANYAWTGSAWDNLGGIEAVDASPVQSSTNPVSSGGVYSALENLQSELEGQISTAGAQPSTSTPLVAGTAAVGTQTAYARGDHRHPAQTSVSGNAGTATKLATARTLALSGDVTGSTSFDGTANRTIAATLASSGVTAGSYGPDSDANLSFGGSVTVPQVTVDAKGRVTEAAGRAIKLPASPTSVSGNAGTATKLATARTIRTNLGTTSAASFDGSANVTPGVTGVLPVANGGTGNTAGNAVSATKATQDGNGNVITTTYATKAEVSTLRMPVGSIYFQLSGQSAPADLFGGTWSNVSSTYAGLFFRAEGGNAATFGSTQDDGAPGITGTWIQTGMKRGAVSQATGALSVFDDYNLQYGDQTLSGTPVGGINLDASLSSAVYGRANEVRPVNSTIRIWKRTA